MELSLFQIIGFSILLIIIGIILHYIYTMKELNNLLKKLLDNIISEIWKCKDSIQRNGRLGQKQNGVDVYGIPLGVSQYYGVQCKGKDEYTHAQLTKTEIDNEIDKARNFKPPLKRFIFASTSNKDAEIEEYIRCKNIVCIHCNWAL